MKLFELIDILSQLNESIDIHGLSRLHQGNPDFDNAVKSYRSTLQGRKKDLLKPFGLDDLDKFKSNPDEFVKMVGYAVDSFKEKKEQSSLYKRIYEDEKCLITMPKGPKGAAAAGSFCKEGENVRCPWCICVKYPENEKWWRHYKASAVFFIYAKKNGVGFDACCIVMRAKDALTTIDDGYLSYSQLEGIENKGLSGNPEAQRKVLEQLYSETGLSDSRLLKILRPVLEPMREPIREKMDAEERLLEAVNKGDVETVRKCLQVGIDVNIYDKYHYTPLLIAAREGHLEICKLLLNAGADANTIGEEWETPLVEAALFGHLEICKLLIDAGADLNGSEYSESPLYLAVDQGYLEICKLLIDAGADVNAKGHYATKETPLSLAKEKGFKEIAQLLIKAGAQE